MAIPVAILVVGEERFPAEGEGIPSWVLSATALGIEERRDMGLRSATTPRCVVERAVSAPRESTGQDTA